MLRLLKNALLFRSLSWARSLHPYPVKFTRANARDLSQGVYVPEADVYIRGTTPAELVLLQDLGAVARAKHELGVEFEFRDGRWVAKLRGLEFIMRNKADPWLLTEIFLDGIYEVPLKSPPKLVIDIGMNCGVASIYLAQKYGCEVHSFELCSPTFEAAEENMALNPGVAGRIHRNCYGLADKSESLEIPYTRSNTVVTSMYGLEEGVAATDRLAVQVVRATNALGPVLERAGGGPVFAKIDCEGAEFPILRDLESSGLLSKIDAIAMEYHTGAGDPRELDDILTRSGFQVSKVGWTEDLGFIKAVRS